MATADDAENYVPVELATLEAGQLVDRPLYAYFAGNRKYIRLAEALQPLEESTLLKLKKLGAAFSDKPAIGVRFAVLGASADSVRALCDDRDSASFEKSRAIRDATRWLVPHVFDPGGDLLAPLFFFKRAFETPGHEALRHAWDVSVEGCERSLKVASVAGVLALWLGYSDTEFLQQLARAVFCEQIVPSPLSEPERLASAKLVADGRVPGIVAVDKRFESFLASEKLSAASGDELSEIVAYSRWVCGVVARDPRSSRVARKLRRLTTAAPTASVAPKEAA